MKKRLIYIILGIIIIISIIICIIVNKKRTMVTIEDGDKSKNKQGIIHNSMQEGIFDVYDADGRYITSFDDESMIEVYQDNPYYDPW